uniref:RING-type domain-containing protein n=1 Tax=Haplochromis burtoni TaxID=8153 RepID=A0A3Q3CB22_HAPBU
SDPKTMDQEKLCCSVCLDLLKKPVTIPCGHNYCMSCIKRHWDKEEPKGAYSCPQCRKVFAPRPELVKNTMLAELVEDLKTPSCLVCLVSYCEQHLQPHYDSSAFDKHKLMFCSTDQQCICYVCCLDKHKRHVTVPVEVERAEKDKDLKMNLQEVQKKIQTRMEEGEVLEKEMEGIKLSADKTIEDSDAIIDELLSYIKEKGSNLKQQIKSQQETEESRVMELQNNLEQEITELRRKEEEKITLTVRSVDVLLPQIEPKTRDDFLKHSCQLTIDPDTVHKNLFLSNQNRTVSDSAPNPNIYPGYKKRDRFSNNQQALSKESLIGPCYWEVERKGKGLSVAVTYK